MAKLAYLLPIVLVAACSSPKASSSPESSAPASSAPPLKEAAPPPADMLPPTVAGGLTWNAAPPLLARKPKSTMRAAEYGLASDPQAELSVFYFGEGQGGDVEANIARWLGQLSQSDGSDTAKHAKRSQRTVSGVKVTLVEATGVFSGGMAMPGAPAPTPQPDAMMLGAIATGPKGPVFFKLVGKRSSVEEARAAFEGLLDSLRPAS